MDGMCTSRALQSGPTGGQRRHQKQNRNQNQNQNQHQYHNQSMGSHLRMGAPTWFGLTVSISIALLVSSQLINSRLIRIYQKADQWRMPAQNSEPLNGKLLLNSSSSNVDASRLLPPGLGGDQEDSGSREFRSPMRRIIDLIHQHHKPVIVLEQADGSLSASGQRPVPVELAGSNSQQVASGQLMDQQQQQQQQHWTVVDTSQLGLLPAGLTSLANLQAQQQQQQLVNQQQQQQQPQPQQQQQYFSFSPASGAAEPLLNQIAVIQPGSLDGASQQAAAAAALSQLMSGPGFSQAASAYQTQSSQNYLQQAAEQQQQQAVQPVFLSSYVPELPAFGFSSSPGASSPPAVQPGGPGLAGQPASPASQQPNSIQAQIKSAPAAGEDSGRPEGDSADSEAEPDSAGQQRQQQQGASAGSEPTDPDEPAGEPDQQAPDGSGSLSYEDKYDSDNESAQQPSSRSTKFRAEPAASNGLVSVGLNDDCLQCICRASSGCDHLLRCITRGAEEKFCGPFQLTEEYWQRAGSPGDQANNFISFEECANDADCAVETVTNYMKKYFRDCDGDENITCMDYARLHRLKPNECDQTDRLQNDHDAYWAKFQRCAEVYNRTRNGDDEDI